MQRILWLWTNHSLGFLGEIPPDYRYAEGFDTALYAIHCGILPYIMLAFDGQVSGEP